MSTKTDECAAEDTACAVENAESHDFSSTGDDETSHGDARKRTRFVWKRFLAYALLPALVLLLTLSAAFFKWQGAIAQQIRSAALQSVPAATDSAIAMLSYRATNVQQDLTAASERLTEPFRSDYLELINEVVIPGAIQKQISAVATIPAAAAVSATANQAVVVVFINQTTTIGNDPPTNTASSVRMTMDKVEGRWMVSQFEPI